MAVGRRVAAVVLGLVGLFVYLGAAIPQYRSTEVSGETLMPRDPEGLSRLGRALFQSDRAQCLTCHSLGPDPRARCPDLQGVGARAATRKPGLSAAAYLVESVYDPEAFVVPGYPAGQMTPVNEPPIALTHDEILAVLTYLGSLGGRADADFVAALRKAQEPWRRGQRAPTRGTRPARLWPRLPGRADAGEAVVERLGCRLCHRIAGRGGEVAPDLTGIGSRQRPEYILESILDPSRVIVKGYRQTIVVWRDEDRMDLRGIAVRWLPAKESPRALELDVEAEGGQRRRVTVPLTEVRYVGDTVVGVVEEDDFESICGEYVAGGEEEGITLRVLRDGTWRTERIPAAKIDFVNPPKSPMPENYGELLTPRELYDLLAVLMTSGRGR